LFDSWIIAVSHFHISKCCSSICYEILVRVIHFSVMNLKAVSETEACVTLLAVDGGVILSGLACVAFLSVHTGLTCVLALFPPPPLFSSICCGNPGCKMISDHKSACRTFLWLFCQFSPHFGNEPFCHFFSEFVQPRFCYKDILRDNRRWLTMENLIHLVIVNCNRREVESLES
jgi:hypothetical protein